jgi:hypothetical protein
MSELQELKILPLLGLGKREQPKDNTGNPLPNVGKYEKQYQQQRQMMQGQPKSESGKKKLRDITNKRSK